MVELRRGGVIDDAELLRMVYKFAGEVADVESILAAGKKAQAWTGSGPERPTLPASKIVDQETGEGKGAAAIG